MRPLVSEGASQAIRRPPCPLDTEAEQSLPRDSEDEEELQLLIDNLQRSSPSQLTEQRRIETAQPPASPAHRCSAHRLEPRLPSIAASRIGRKQGVYRKS